MEYHRPRSLDEAISLLKQGVPLAGGTSLTPRRRGLSAVVDLQELGLDRLTSTETRIDAGACLTLQSLAETSDNLLPALSRVCHLEAGWNLRNMATIAGSLMGADGRSPLVTALLALGTKVILQPGEEQVDLDDLLARREAEGNQRLITTVMIPRPRWLAYDQVARSPADRPIVCAALAEKGSGTSPGRHGLALGGFGRRPVLLSLAAGQTSDAAIADQMGRLASEAYAQAGDAWASAEYRSEVAGVLVRRLFRVGPAS